MYRFGSNEAYLLYPHSNIDTPAVEVKVLQGVNGGSITNLGLRIPRECSDFYEFVQKMKVEEKIFCERL